MRRLTCFGAATTGTDPCGLESACCQSAWLDCSVTTALSRAFLTTPLSRALAGGGLLFTGDAFFLDPSAPWGDLLLAICNSPTWSPPSISSKSSKAVFDLLDGVCHMVPLAAISTHTHSHRQHKWLCGHVKRKTRIDTKVGRGKECCSPR